MKVEHFWDEKYNEVKVLLETSEGLITVDGRFYPWSDMMRVVGV